MKNSLFLLVLLTLYKIATAQFDPSHSIGQKFSLRWEHPEGYNTRDVLVQTEAYATICHVKPKSPVQTIFSEDNIISWKIRKTEPYWLNLLFIRDNNIVYYLAEPGDSISISTNNEHPTFTGKGAKSWELVCKIHELDDSLNILPEYKTLSKRTAVTDSLQDYFKWNEFLNKKTDVFLRTLNFYKPYLSNLSYESYKKHILLYIESRRLWKFNYLRLNARYSEKNQYGLTNSDLCKIYDSTMLGPNADWLLNKTQDFEGSQSYLWEMLKLELYRKNQRFFRISESDSKVQGDRPEDPYIRQYDLAKRKYKGIKREKLIAYTFYAAKGIFESTPITPAVDSLVNDYYSQPGFPEYKEGVKKVEQKYREKYAKLIASPFELLDRNGNTFRNTQLLGKLAILDFWYTGCKGCVQMAPALREVADYFQNDSNVVFVGVSIDKDKKKWLNSLQKGIFTSGDGIQLYTSGKGANHSIIQDYYISSYPSLYAIDPKGKIVPFNKYEIDPRRVGSKKMIEWIKNQLALSKDGPYIFHNQADSITVHNFRNGQIFTRQDPENAPGTFEFVTDDNSPAKFSIKKNLSIAPSRYDQPENVFILSDIEGEFAALKKLLVANQVIDNDLNWTFGKGHLVFAGDMFDRGEQVTECLWLIYSLEEKALAAGGYVHFILGNHEMMNLQGDHEYVREKYKENAGLLKKSLKSIYDNRSELGRWLRTKNVIEKIGNMLVLHGGVSDMVNDMQISLEEINEKCRQCIDSSCVEIKDVNQRILVHGELSPFWYRGYYGGGTRPSRASQIDSTLQKFDVRYIITGHTVVSDTIKVLHNGKVINTDTRHKAGNSEALMITEGYFYRVNAEGVKVKLSVNAEK